MAMPKKGARIITINGTKFRRRVRRKPTYNQELANSPMTFSVELAHNPKSVLLVETPYAHPNNFMNEPIVSILPSYVANCIKSALKKGWTPSVQGKPFIMKDIRHFLWHLPTEHQITEEDWNVIIDFLLKELETYLSTTIELIDFWITYENGNGGFGSRIKSHEEYGGRFAFSWAGSLYMEYIDGKGYIDAEIFLFSRGRRLSIYNPNPLKNTPNEEIIYLTYQKDETGQARWINKGWDCDANWEWQSILNIKDLGMCIK